MRDPLENIAVGNFLYGLGLSMGTRAGERAPRGCVNLLQQTPLDRPLGDVMIRYPGAVVRLYEFKRESADMTKEKRKLTVLEAAIRRRPDLRAVSQEIHWYVETKRGRPDFSFEARPYLDMRERVHTHLGLAETIDQVVSHALGAEHEHEIALIQEYLDAVALFAGKRDGTSSGMLVTVDAKGGVSYVGVEDIRDLRETPLHLLERMKLEDLRERSIQLELERTQKPSKGFELTLG